MRGCTRGCRFCHAGTWYRPVRERPADEVVKAGLAQLACTGYDELSLTSLATSDYTGIVPAIERHQVAHAHPAPVAAVQPGRHRPGGADRRGQRPPELDHAGARGGHAADARHHLQDDHRRDDRAGDRGGLQGRLHEPEAVLHDRPAARDARRGAGHRRPRHPGARDRPARAPGRRALLGARRASRTSCPSRTRPSSGRACRAGRSSTPSRRTCAGRCPPARSGSRSTTCAPRCSRVRSRRGGEDHGRCDRARLASRCAVRRLERDVPGGTPGRRRSRPAARASTSRPRESSESGTSCRGITCARASPRSSCWTSGGQSRAEVATGDCRWDGCTDCGACFGPVRNRLVN